MFVKWITKLEHSEISIKRQIQMEWVMIVMTQIQMRTLKVTMASGHIQLWKRKLVWWIKKLNMQINWKERCQLEKLQVNIIQMHRKCQQQVVKIFHQEKMIQWEVQKISSSTNADPALMAKQLHIKNKLKQKKMKK